MRPLPSRVPGAGVVLDAAHAETRGVAARLVGTERSVTQVMWIKSLPQAFSLCGLSGAKRHD
ncbi:MAG: hypothetical protein KAR25_02375 [Methanosarcinales archaeon]|nr:hypothetical protein [Methanosarcinales archaeon]